MKEYFFGRRAETSLELYEHIVDELEALVKYNQELESVYQHVQILPINPSHLQITF